MACSKGWSFLLLLALACAPGRATEPTRAIGKGCNISHYLPPPPLAPGVMPAFQRGEPQAAGDRLDQFEWTLIDSLVDDVSTPNAVPTGILFFPSSRRGYISTLHAIFKSEDGGAHWTKTERRGYSVLSPNYVYGLAAYSADPYQVHDNLLYITHLNAITGKGYVRKATFYGLSQYIDHREEYRTDYWLGPIVLPDTMHLVALGSWDGYALFFERLNGDSSVWVESLIDPLGGWVTGPMAYVNGFIYLAGVRHWVSFDSGRTWQVRPCADEIFDGGATFVDTLYGWTGGGRIEPQSQGWVHRTTDGGLTWSGRLLETDYPIRTVHFLTREIGFAAGGNYESGVGGIWSTLDGGQTWHEDAAIPAEITVLGSRRDSPAYVDIYATGFYPDFIGGVWHRRLFLPDTTGAVLVARPDTLDFGATLPGDRDTLSFWAVNVGSQAITITTFFTSDSVFCPLPEPDSINVAPGDSVKIPVEFRPDSVETYSATIFVYNTDNQDVRVTCRGEGADLAAETSVTLLPQKPSVSVYPNPGNPDFHITFTLPTRADICLAVYNILGKQVATLAEGSRQAGTHRLTWRAQAVSSGVYFVRLEGTASPQTVKLCVVR